MATASRNPLPCYIGLMTIAVVDSYVVYLLYATRCEAPGIAQFLVLVIVPGVDLALTYLTLKSQPLRPGVV